VLALGSSSRDADPQSFLNALLATGDDDGTGQFVATTYILPSVFHAHSSMTLRSAFVTLLFAVALWGGSAVTVVAQESSVALPRVALAGVPFEVRVEGLEADSGMAELRADEKRWTARISDGTATFEDVEVRSGTTRLVVRSGQVEIAAADATAIPGWISIMPALIAIVVALITRQVIPALFSGVWLGAWMAYGLSLKGAWLGLLDTVAVYVIEVLSNPDQVSIIVFSLMIGGMVGIISRNGGTQGIVNTVVRWASSPKRGQLATAFLGLAIFFDDYANTLIVGNTMRPVTDRLRISREKLAYVVDSTAAPVTTLALVTTWIGFQVGLIDAAVSQIDGYSEAAYSVFLNSIPYSFYPILAIFFVLLVAGTRRDFGPMLRAERRARLEGLVSRPGAAVGETAEESEALKPKSGAPHRLINAVLPVLVLVLGTLVGIYVTGVADPSRADDTLRTIIGAGDSYRSLLWASLLGVMVAATLSLGQRILRVGEVVDAWFAGMKSMMLAIIILVLAWSLASVNDVLHTADYLITVLEDSLNPGFVPGIVFLLAAATAFATGSSWGVMGIMVPLIIPLAWAIMAANGLTADMAHYHILYSSVSAVLAGAVWGDHCSPISDTTILSSMASGCDHIDHVRTQLPYAGVVGLVGLLVGTVPVGFGMPWWIALAAGAAILATGLRLVGKRSEEGVRFVTRDSAGL
jgi:Na+/H+ antiporter NhaC